MRFADFASDSYETRLHSSRMRTARTLTVSRSMLCAGGGWGVYLVPRGVLSLRGGVLSPQGGVWSRGVSDPRGVVTGQVPPPLWTDRRL